jgi:chromosome partitioning protein
MLYFSSKVRIEEQRMPVIALVGNKGGAGKTTLTVNLAVGLGRVGRVVILDTDPQGSSAQWRTIANDQTLPSVISTTENLVERVRDLENEYDYLVVDCPPSVQAPQTLSILQVSDVALIPVQPSPLDLWASIHIEKAVMEAKENNPTLRALLVINQLEPRTTLSQLMREALAEIKAPVADTSIRRRAVYRASALEGRSVYAMGKRGADAAAELDQLIQEVTR